MAKTPKKCHGTRRLYRGPKPTHTQRNQGEEITSPFTTNGD